MDIAFKIVCFIVLPLVSLGVLFSFLRFVKGPTAADRVVALDTMSIIITASLVLLGALFERFIYVDVALIYGVLGFIGVIVIARYIEGAL
jgi:multicomponent Na+:H+ antiporter subunit F